jgi:hypothetical protein
VTILDRENGADEYGRRLKAILADRPPKTREAVRERLTYHAWPRLQLEDRDAIAAHLAGADLVVFDSTRTFLSSLGMSEDLSDDFARYASNLIDPLFAAGIATVQLDNTGHADSNRARGSASKGDLADVVYSLKAKPPFDVDRRGAVRLKREASRFGDVLPEFTLELGAGHFGHFAPTDASAVPEPGPAFRPTVLMERLSRAIEEEPGLTSRALRRPSRAPRTTRRTSRSSCSSSRSTCTSRSTGRPAGTTPPGRSGRPTTRPCPRARTVPQPCPAHARATVPPCPYL